MAIPLGNYHHDPAHKVRRVLDLLNKTFKDNYAAAQDLTVDESMVGHKGKDYTVQYMPAKKAHRWHAKLWVLAEPDTGYTLSMDLYAGMFSSIQNLKVFFFKFEKISLIYMYIL